MGDFEFKNLYVSVTRSLVDQHVGPVKTEASRKLMPIDEYVAHDLLAFHENAGLSQVKLWRLDVFAVAVAVVLHNIHLPS